jgi:hypothetical protein
MIVKTEKFVDTLNSKLYQYSFNRKIPLSLKGSFKQTTYVSDIDFTAYVYFNKKFIEILIHKLKNLKDFKFLYLNAGTDKDFKLPWIIKSEWGCDFDIISAKKWFKTFKQKELIPKSSYDEIENILYRKKLILGDLVDIQEILDEFNVIKWFLPDIKKGNKTIRGYTYNLLEELVNESGAVLNSIYIDGNNIVSVDLGLVDKRIKHSIPDRMYKYYTQNWYRILKSYKKLINPDYRLEYLTTMKTLEYNNALLAQVSLLNSLMKYKVVSQKHINYVAQDLQRRLEKEEIKSTSLKDITKILQTELNNSSKGYVDYFLDKLTYNGKIKTYQRLRLTEISKIPTSKKTLKNRRKNGIKCPFFETDVNEIIGTISEKLLLDKEQLRKCLELVKNKHVSLLNFTRNIFRNEPVSRLFLQSSDDKNIVYIRGALVNDDDILFNSIGTKKNEYYSFHSKYIKRLQIYLISGY